MLSTTLNLFDRVTLALVAGLPFAAVLFVAPSFA